MARCPGRSFGESQSEAFRRITERFAYLERKNVMYKTLIGALSSALLFATAAVAADQAAKPTDPQIAHIAYTVRAFAQQMVGDHTAVNNQALALVKKLNVKPEDNPTSQSLTKQAEATRNKFTSLNGAAFDKAYIDNEVAYHKTVNTALSDTLIPDAQNAELKALLQSGLGVFQAHQKHAKQIASKLQSGSASQ